MDIRTLYSSALVNAFDGCTGDRTVTIYPHGRGQGHVSVIWSLSLDEARGLLTHLAAAIAAADDDLRRRDHAAEAAPQNAQRDQQRDEGADGAP